MSHTSSPDMVCYAHFLSSTPRVCSTFGVLCTPQFLQCTCAYDRHVQVTNITNVNNWCLLTCMCMVDVVFLSFIVAFVAKNYPANSFQRILWEQQAKAASLKDSQSMKWHSIMIRWSLYLHHLSGSAYESLRESGVIKLPFQRTLRDYTY